MLGKVFPFLLFFLCCMLRSYLTFSIQIYSQRVISHINTTLKVQISREYLKKDKFSVFPENPLYKHHTN